MMGRHAGIPATLNAAVHEVNQRQRERFFDKIAGHYQENGGSLKGKTLAFWGIAFKPRTDDIREAPALSLIRRAIEAGATVRAHDPVANDNARRELGGGGGGGHVALFDDMYAAVEGADALVVCTDWDEFKNPDFERIARVMKDRVVFDGRNLYRRQQMGDLGFTYYSVGRAPVKPA
jgi:UDPglucose 6-dehydrogenase